MVEELVVGAYWKRLEEEDNAAGYLFGGDATDLNGRYEIDNLAFYGQYRLALSEKLRLEVNARLDRNDTAYEGMTTNYGADSTSTAFAVDQWLGGGKAALSYNWRSGHTLYASASRGYRSGGVNQHPKLAAENRPYDPEYIVNLEFGWRVSGPRSSIGLTLFHALRSDQQVELSSQQDPGRPQQLFLLHGQCRQRPQQRLGMGAYHPPPAPSRTLRLCRLAHYSRRYVHLPHGRWGSDAGRPRRSSCPRLHF